MVVFLTVFFIITAFAGIFSHGLVSAMQYIFSTAVIYGIGYIIYRKNVGLQQYPYWSCFIVTTVISNFLSAVLAVMGPIAIVMGVLLGLAVLYFDKGSGPIAFVHEYDKKHQKVLRLKAAFIVLIIGGFLFGLNMLFPVTETHSYSVGKQRDWSSGSRIPQYTNVYMDRTEIKYVQTTLRSLGIILATGLIIFLLPKDSHGIEEETAG